MKKLVIFDVDGTLVSTKSGATFRKSADDWQWLPGRLQKLQTLDRLGVKLAVASNQGGVAYGLLDPREIRHELQRMAGQKRRISPMWQCASLILKRLLSNSERIAHVASRDRECCLRLSKHLERVKRIQLWWATD